MSIYIYIYIYIYIGNSCNDLPNFSFILKISIFSGVILEPSLTAMMEHLAKIVYGLFAVNYFHKKAPSQMFEWALNTPLLLH